MKTRDIDKVNCYINFSISNEFFAIPISKVLEILPLNQLTLVPNAPDFIKGILNFRGAIVPVINLRKRFNFVRQEVDGNMVVVVEVIHGDKPVLMGLLVDEVTDVIEFEYKDIRSVPETGIKYNPEFLEGFIETNGKFTMVLDLDRVLSITELTEIKQVVNT
jgi:purine-binding chemotaxis protein CheW